MAYITIFATAILIFLVYFWLKNQYSYWQKRGVIGPTPLPLLGNAGRVMFVKESVHDLAKRLYDEFPHEKVVGFYQGLTPALLVRDPDLIKEITVKEFQSFRGRGLRLRDDRFEDNLFLTEGETWKILREKLNPIFSSTKVKGLMPLIDDCNQRFLQHIEQLIDKEGPEHDIRTLSSLLMLDVNGTCSFGVALQMYSREENIFVKVAEGILAMSTTLGVRRIIQLVYPGFEECLDKYLNIKSPVEQLNRFFVDLIKNIVKKREREPEKRNDLLNSLIELKEVGSVNNVEGEIAIDDELIAAQAMSFYAAGFEPASLFLNFTLFEMALNQDIQKRVYKEISDITMKHNGKITYESLKEMNYLKMIMDEIIRKYPVSLNRQCSERYTFPDQSLTIEKGTPILIPVNGLHLDPKYYKDPHVFDPERFAPDNRSKISPLTYIPFGLGPRHCIGARYGRVQCLMGAAYFLNKFRVYPTVNTPRSSSELRTDPRFITLRTIEAIWLGFEKRLGMQ